MKLPRRQFLHLAAGAAALPAAARFRFRANLSDAAGAHRGRLRGRHRARPLCAHYRSMAVGAARPAGRHRQSAGCRHQSRHRVGGQCAPDGYTLLMASTAAFTNAALYDNLRFNFIRDIAPVASLSRGAFVMVVNPSFPAKTVPSSSPMPRPIPARSTWRRAASAPQTTSPASCSRRWPASTWCTFRIAAMGPSSPTSSADRVQVYFVALAGAAEFIKAGKVRALAVTTAQRSAAFPEIPTVGEFVPGYEASLRNGLGAPKATPADIIAKLNTEINAGLNDPKIKSQFAALGTETVPLTTAEYGKIIVEETEKWGKVIRGANIKAE